MTGAGGDGRGRRRSVCYVVPGHGLLTSAGPTRNVLSVARALGREWDVTVAFRSVMDATPPEDVSVLELEPGHRIENRSGDDAALRNVGFGEFLGYLRALKRFVSGPAREFDVVLEKGWLLSGYVCWLCSRREIPAVAVENLLPGAPSAGWGLMKRGRTHVGARLSAHLLRGAPRVIAETQALRRVLVERCGVSEQRIDVVPLGVDRERFRPGDRQAARRSLGIAPSAEVLLYVGVLDRTHDLFPVLEALGHSRRPSLELHVVGDGPLAPQYRAAVARHGVPAVFHGRVPHEEVPGYIAASDLCLAPYSPEAFEGGEVVYSTLKIPEYLSCGRPVVSVPAGRIGRLVREGVTGFLFPNERRGWIEFLRCYPGDDALRRMGRAAAETPLETWAETARGYRLACERVLGAAGDGGRRR